MTEVVKIDETNTTVEAINEDDKLLAKLGYK